MIPSIPLLLLFLFLPSALPLSITLIGSTSTLSSYLLPLLPSAGYSSYVCYTGPTKDNWGKLKDRVEKIGGGLEKVEEKEDSLHLLTHNGLKFRISHYPPLPSSPNIEGDCVFISPPSAFGEEYGENTKTALTACNGGRFVLISSCGIYPDTLQSPITPTTPLPPTSTLTPRQLKILKGERPVLNDVDGDSVVVRCSGLYTLSKGAHRYWLSTGVVKGGRGGLVNLIHYGDVARLVKEVLGEVEGGGKVRIANDDREGGPMCREDICRSAYESKWFNEGGKFGMPVFEDEVDSKRGRKAGVVGKVYESGEKMEGRGYRGFDLFMNEDGDPEGVYGVN